MEVEDEVTETETENDGAKGDPKPKPEDQSKGKRRRPSANEEASRFRRERNTLREELGKLQGTVTEMATNLKTQETARLAAEARALDASRKAIALKHGIPEKLADRLKGTTEAEIEADAIEVAKDLPAKPATPPPADPVKPGASPANPASGGTGLTLEQLKTMKPNEIEKLDQKEVNRVLSGG
jgi:chromosome segregation ATPase